MKVFISSDEWYPVASLDKDLYYCDGSPRQYGTVIEVSEEELKAYDAVVQEFDRWQKVFFDREREAKTQEKIEAFKKLPKPNMDNFVF